MKTNELNTLLATVAVVKQKAYNLHWNVRGDEFYSIHKLTDEVFKGLVGFFDEFAEKIAMLGNVPYSTYREYLDNSKVKEVESRYYARKEVCEILSKDLATLVALAKAVPSSETVQPLIDEFYLFADKYHWLLASHLSK